jgi:integrase
MSTRNQGKSRLPAPFDVNTAEHEVAPENQKSAHEMHTKPTKATKALPKTAAAYWLAKVHKPGSSPHYNAQIAHRKQRHRFPLETADRAIAAERARDRYLHIVAHGWPATLEKFKPEAVKALKIATIGSWLESVKATAEIRPATFTNYANSIRQIASEIEGIGDQPATDEHGEPKRDRRKRIVYLSRFNAQGGGNALWLAKVDALPLSILTAAAAQKWKLAYIDKAGASPDARRRAENTATSRLRSARALFSAEAREFAGADLILPNPLPFVSSFDLKGGRKKKKKPNAAYQSKIDAAELIDKAKKELTGEPFKIFALGLLCGLRKREIDLLTWSQVDFTKGVVRIERTEYFTPKSEDSTGEVDLDAELLAMLRGWKATSSGPFVIESARAPRHESSRVYYRCESDFAALYAWLRKHGVKAQKPLHELRKELGAILASAHGIFAAQSVLRHAQISTTAAYYTDKKRRITAGLGALLTASPANVVEADFKPAQKVSKSKREARTA